MNKLQTLDEYRAMGKNFMTPNVREYELTKDGRIIELSQGIGLDGKNIYGVSEFVTVDGRLQSTGRGQMHRTIMSARRHYNRLK